MSHPLVLAAPVLALLMLPREALAQAPADASAAFKDDVHAAVELTCASCHATTPRGAPDSIPRTAIAPICARCHADAEYMRRFDPQVRVDQFAQYQTSTHGVRMAAGETRVATCSDCHGSHGIRRVNDARAPVAPANVATTCARCHADADRMAALGHDAAAPADWAGSVHAAALLQRGDRSAPTCSSCHGSHGATPPGVSTVANVCAQCHVREAELFRASPKREIFDAIGQAECLACHGNHRITSPADSWVGVQEGAVCAQCHDESSGGASTITAVRQQLVGLTGALDRADAILTRAERAGMLVDEGRQRLRTARQEQVQSRVLVHTFAAAPFAEAAGKALAAAQEAEAAGEAALQELDVRRRGLAVATLLILAFLVTLGLKIRRLPPA